MDQHVERFVDGKCRFCGESQAGHAPSYCGYDKCKGEGCDSWIIRPVNKFGLCDDCLLSALWAAEAANQKLRTENDDLKLAIGSGRLVLRRERDELTKRVEFLQGFGARRFDDAKKFYDELEATKAKLAEAEHIITVNELEYTQVADKLEAFRSATRILIEKFDPSMWNWALTAELRALLRNPAIEATEVKA